MKLALVGKVVCFCVFLLGTATLDVAKAYASIEIGTSCSTVGTTQLSADKKNLIACLLDDSGALVWKAMTLTPCSTGQILSWNGSAWACASQGIVQCRVCVEDKVGGLACSGYAPVSSTVSASAWSTWQYHEGGYAPTQQKRYQMDCKSAP